MTVLKIIGIILGWFVLGFLNTRIKHLITQEYEDLESYCFCTLFAPIIFPIGIFVLFCKWLYKLYEKIFY